jgi:hypothetical protein
VVPLFQRLVVKMLRELGKVLVVEPDRDGDVLLGSGELVANLLLEQLVELAGHIRKITPDSCFHNLAMLI